MKKKGTIFLVAVYAALMFVYAGLLKHQNDAFQFSGIVVDIHSSSILVNIDGIPGNCVHVGSSADTIIEKDGKKIRFDEISLQDIVVVGFDGWFRASAPLGISRTYNITVIGTASEEEYSGALHASEFYLRELPALQENP